MLGGQVLEERSQRYQVYQCLSHCLPTGPGPSKVLEIKTSSAVLTCSNASWSMRSCVCSGPVRTCTYTFVTSY